MPPAPRSIIAKDRVAEQERSTAMALAATERRQAADRRVAALETDSRRGAAGWHASAKRP
ncbi:hypothetical protein Pa4123_88720 [Phytohabitans aurantiacus]|uniref:Uncharacterized protein n=1 Tax=Phytohabitans aurantiacus TaxID=3016789 RepID=A0ABQ5RA00_9ACTN|nr:hypothetical protein Pa4123_88720 [Phytohabitans aurantiacus]